MDHFEQQQAAISLERLEQYKADPQGIAHGEVADYVDRIVNHYRFNALRVAILPVLFIVIEVCLLVAAAHHGWLAFLSTLAGLIAMFWCRVEWLRSAEYHLAHHESE